MILQAGNDCYLTQTADVPLVERVFENQVLIYSAEQVKEWKEIPSSEKDRMFAEKNFVDVDSLDYAALQRLDGLVSEVTLHINSAGLNDAQAVEMQKYFPSWEQVVSSMPALLVEEGTGFTQQGTLPVGFRVQYEGKLYEVIKEHIPSKDVNPNRGFEGYYQQVVAYGDPIGPKGPNADVFKNNI